MTSVDAPTREAATMGTTAAIGGVVRRSPISPPTPARLGRYVVGEEVGRGGMGRVLRAYDPTLRREVALKLLHTGGGDSEAAKRIVREAQAMAQLSDPNLVPVYDVDREGDEVFIAMEFVEGETLRSWLVTRRRWSDVLAAFIGAGRGLAAAHDAGIVHRDFKPSNAIVGRDGRVRVMDFGIARGVPTSIETTGDAGEDSIPSAAPLELTEAGSVLGTPPYMAPEQHRGEVAVAATDQYAFCVALFEGLFGVRPFVGADLADLLRAKLRGPSVPKAAVDRGVPEWLIAAVFRGLAVDPSARWRTMRALLAVLERGQGRARVRRVVLGVAVVGFVASGLAGARHLNERSRIDACEQAGTAIDADWNEERRTAVRERLLASGASHAASTAERVIPWLDAHAVAWRTARIDACLDTDVRRVWNADTFDRALLCLDDRRLDLVALVQALNDAERDGVSRAVAAAAGLREIGPCRDAALLIRSPLPPTDAPDDLRDVRALYSRASALAATGSYATGLGVAREALTRAEAIGWLPMVSRVRAQLGLLLALNGSPEEAATVLEAAYFEALTAGATEDALRAAQTLAYTLGVDLARYEDAERWARHADALQALLPDPVGLRQAVSDANLARLRYKRGEYDDAAMLQQRAFDGFEAAFGSDHPNVALNLGRIADIRGAMGAYGEAVELHRRAVSMLEAVLGPEHPDVADGLGGLATALAQTGAVDEAAELYRRALVIEELALGPDHVRVGDTLQNLANVRLMAGAFDEAAKLYDRSLAIAEKTRGPGHPSLALMLSNMGSLQAMTGAHDEAARLFLRALAIQEQALGAEHPDVADSLDNLAMVRVTQGAYDDAGKLYTRALAIFEKSLGADNPRAADPLLGLAEVALAQGRGADAVGFAERGLTLRSSSEAPPNELAAARFLVARALVLSGASGARAFDLARQARDAYREGGEADRVELDRVETWLAKHEPSQ